MYPKLFLLQVEKTVKLLSEGSGRNTEPRGPISHVQVRSARRLLQKPNVVEGEVEPGACVWCYCCEQEVEKHVTDRQVSIEWGGLLEHMARYV